MTIIIRHKKKLFLQSTTNLIELMRVINNISISQGLEIASNVLQYAMPACAWIVDIAPDIYTNDFEKILKKSFIVGLLIIAQNRGGQYLKNQIPKMRPNGNDMESFPSGHMMIAAQSAVHLIYKCGLDSQAGAFAVAGSIVMVIGRYLPGHQDMVDLTAGTFFGSLLGLVWNKCVV